MTMILIASGALIWLFIGLVSSQLIWRSLPDERGSFRYEWGPIAGTLVASLTLLGPLAAYFYASHLTANKILSTRTGTAIKADRERLLNKIYEKALKDDMDIAEIGQLKVEDLEMDSELPVI